MCPIDQQPHLEMIHLSRASMLSNACARWDMHKFGSLVRTGKVTENRNPKTTLLIITPAYLRLRSSCLALEIAQPELSSGRASAFNGSVLIRIARGHTSPDRRIVDVRECGNCRNFDNSAPSENRRRGDPEGIRGDMGCGASTPVKRGRRRGTGGQSRRGLN